MTPDLDSLATALYVVSRPAAARPCGPAAAAGRPARHTAGDRAAETWVAQHAPTNLAGGSEQAAASISAAADAVGLKPGSRKGIDDAVGYLKNKAAYLQYDTALSEGFPIATGIIEGDVPPPGQRPPRHHRSPLGPFRRRCSPETPCPAQQ